MPGKIIGGSLGNCLQAAGKVDFLRRAGNWALTPLSRGRIEFVKGLRTRRRYPKPRAGLTRGEKFSTKYLVEC